ncbi:hypothetical protein WICPIJ_006604 [Wickerhamomyces pijperi]|uniref:Uncharacterized protein n=1 Tax=Wickerhamomyces pijperi TaxID=599730 RepID=A0A9P8Q1S8_WICPI|nr:hypothetical protein WICPIJ_006604 [Wickerhamomyces pijperi]
MVSVPLDLLYCQMIGQFEVLVIGKGFVDRSTKTVERNRQTEQQRECWHQIDLVHGSVILTVASDIIIPLRQRLERLWFLRVHPQSSLQLVLRVTAMVTSSIHPVVTKHH